MRRRRAVSSLTGCLRNDDRSSPRASASKPPLQKYSTAQTHTAKASRNETRRSTCSRSTTHPWKPFTNAQLAHSQDSNVLPRDPCLSLKQRLRLPHSRGNAGQILAPNRTLGLLAGLCAENGASSRESIRDHSIRRSPEGEKTGKGDTAVLFLD